MSLECINNIIGLSRTSCDCFDPKPVGYDTSTSGLFIDELESINLKMADSVSPCEKGGLWDLLALARQNAIKVFETELLACITSVTKVKRKTHSGFIGELDYTTVKSPSGAFIGWRLTMPNIEGAYLRIKAITTLMDSNATFDVNVYSNLQDGPIHTFVGIESEALKRKDNDVTDLELPLFSSKVGEELIYYILFEPTTFNPLDNEIDCGCGGKKRHYEDFFDIDGVGGADPLTLAGQKLFSDNGFANGLCIDMDVFCTIQDVICQHSVHASDPIFLVMAAAINFKAGELLVNMINASGNINRYTLLNQERLWGRGNKFATEYRTRVQYLCGEIDVSDSDCIMCKNESMNNVSLRS